MSDDPGRGSPIDDDVFDERNPFLDALLGVISLAERAMATAVELAPPQPPVQASSYDLVRDPPTGRVLR